MSAPVDAPTLARRKRLRRVLVLLFLLVVVPLALVGGAYFFVQSPAGESLIRQRVLAAVGEALAGKVEAERVELSGNHVVLINLKLFTPEGELVASLARVEADVELAGLVAQRVHLENVKVQTPRLHLKQDERGWNLLRAVAAKTTPTRPSAPSGPVAWRLQFDGFDLTDGWFDFEQPDRRVTATKLTANGSLKLRLEPLELTGTLALASTLTAPLEDSLVATVTASTTQGPQDYDVVITLGGSRLRGRVELPAVALTVDELVAAPRELTAFLPGWPLRPTVYGKGSLSLGRAALQLSAGKARAELEAKYDLATFSAQTLAARGREIDFQELVGAPLPSALAFEVTGAVHDWRPETLSGALEGKATWDAKSGRRLASAKLSASAEKGALTVSKVDVVSPGLTLKARGTLSHQTVDAFGTLKATDLGELGKTLLVFAAIDVPGLGGNGTVRVSLQGPVQGPAATVVGQLNQLSIAGVQADSLEFNADVPDVSKPLDTDVLLHARRLRVAERAFDDVTFDVITHGRELDLDLTAKGLADLRVHAIALLDKDARGGELTTMLIGSADVSWGLESPTRLEWKDGFSIAPFALRDGEQRFEGELVLTPARLEAKARVERLELARLPRVVAPASLELAGMLSADVAVTGTTTSPQVSARAQLVGGKVKGFDALDANVEASWLAERAKGTLWLKSALGRLDGTFDVPVLAFLKEQPGQGTAHFAIHDVPTRGLEQQLGRKLPIEGLLSAVVDLSGTGEHPNLKVSLDSDELMLTAGPDQKVSVQGVVLSASTTQANTLDASLRFATLGAQSALTLSTPLSLASLRRHLPTVDELLAIPVTLQLAVKSLNLKALDALHLVRDDELAGAVSLEGTLTGSANAPTGELTLTLEQVTWPPLQKANGHFTLRTDTGRTRLTGTGSLAQQQALELTASIAALPQRALAAFLAASTDRGDAVVDALREVPLEVLLVLAPTPLTNVVVKPDGETFPGGVLSATLEAGGTLEAPTARLVGSLKDLRFDRVALGSARFDLRSTGTEQRYTVALGGEGRDDFKAKGTLGLDLRLSALRHGLDWRKAPLDATLESRHFDLAFLSGSTELPAPLVASSFFTSTRPSAACTSRATSR